MPVQGTMFQTPPPTTLQYHSDAAGHVHQSGVHGATGRGQRPRYRVRGEVYSLGGGGIRLIVANSSEVSCCEFAKLFVKKKKKVSCS